MKACKKLCITKSFLNNSFKNAVCKISSTKIKYNYSIIKIKNMLEHLKNFQVYENLKNKYALSLEVKTISLTNFHINKHISTNCCQIYHCNIKNKLVCRYILNKYYK